ncbi:DUF808 domain-containing protein [Dietzia sp.]|uniref:DUF808 domain-containing protein n=1 Tax=Dietzia sp. TaxID=1871616 RepID=UPI002FD9E839
MAGGLVALLDDIATLARMSAASIDDVAAAAGKTSVKAAGVVVDDTAVTPQYLEGIDASRELPMIRKITIGSLRNKLLIILPIALLLSSFAPWLITPILMLGGSYLCFEGAEKLWEMVRGAGKTGGKSTEDDAGGAAPAAATGPEAEKKVVSGAVRTDLILSAEIMIISLNEVAEQSVWMQAGVLVVVGILMTVIVYGVVAVIVKMDDVGAALAKRDTAGVAAAGRGLVKAMPVVLQALSVIGTFAMTWVGGHILLNGITEFGWHWPHDAIATIADPAHHIPGVGGALAWIIETLIAFIVGAIWGGIIAAVVHVLPFGHHGADSAGSAEATTDEDTAAPR